MTDLTDFEMYLREEELAESTVYSYMKTMGFFFGEYSEFDKKNILAYKAQLMKKNSPKTVNLRLCAIRKYAEFLDEPIKLKQVKVQKYSCVSNVITIEEYEKLLQGLEQDGQTEWLINVKVLAKTGARISEANRFTKKDFINGYAMFHTKGKVRRIAFPTAKRAERSFALKSQQNLFLQSRLMQSSARGWKYKLLTYHSVKLGAQALRFAIEFLKRNPNISLLADLLGHSGVNTTMIYLRMSQEQQQEELDKAVDW